MEEDYDTLVKIVIVGDSAVGKTNLLSRFSLNKFDDSTRNTIGVDFSAVDLNIKGQKIKAQFWDTAGQEKYRSIASAYYKNAQGVIMVYDITRRETFQNIDNWWDELKEQGEPDISMILIGNKNDLEAERTVTIEEASSMSKQKEIFFMEVSAKTNQDDCVRTAFLTLLEEIITRQENKQKESQVFELEDKKSRMGSRSEENFGDANPSKRSCC